MGENEKNIWGQIKALVSSLWISLSNKTKSLARFIYFHKTIFFFIVGFSIGLLFAVFYYYIIVGFIAFILGIILEKIANFINKRNKNSHDDKMCAICKQKELYKESKLCKSCWDIQKQVEIS